MLAQDVGVANSVLHADHDGIGAENLREALTDARGLRALHAAEDDVAVGQRRGLGGDLQSILGDHATCPAIEVRKDEARSQELPPEPRPPDEDHLRSLGGEAAADVTADRSGAHDADTHVARHVF